MPLIPILISLLVSGSAQAMEKNVFGEDNRVEMTSTAYPWSAIGKLRATGSYCTASLIGEKLVLTNAHCVEGKRGLKFYPNYKKGKGKSYKIKEVLAQGGEKFPRDIKKDWAILLLEEPAGIEHGFFSVAEKSEKQDNLILAGYSSDFKRGRTAGIHEGCEIHKTRGSVVQHDCDMTAGASGSPILRKINDNEYQVVALHSAQKTKLGGKIYENGVDYSSRTTNIAVKNELFYDLVQKFILEN